MVECAHNNDTAVREVRPSYVVIVLKVAPRTVTSYCMRIDLTFSLMQGLALATRLHFEFYSEAQPDAAEGPGLQVIDVPRLDQQPGNEYDIFCQLIKQYNVPEALRYKPSPQTDMCSMSVVPAAGTD